MVAKMAVEMQPDYSNGYRLFIIYLRVVILVSTPVFWGSMNPFWPKQILLDNLISYNSKMAA